LNASNGNFDFYLQFSSEKISKFDHQKYSSFFQRSQNVVTRKQVSDNGMTGFCGAWEDDRSADEIIVEIVEHRSGFGGRKVIL
jgi:hypothetical protein